MATILTTEDVLTGCFGVTLKENVVRDNSVFPEQTPYSTTYFCANGLSILIEDRPDGQAGSFITWTYEGTEYSYNLTSAALVFGGAWDKTVESTNIVMTGGDVGYGLFGGGVKEGADVLGDVSVVVTGGYLYDGVVGGGSLGDVLGNISVVIGDEYGNGPNIRQNVIGGGFFGNVGTAEKEGSITLTINGVASGYRYDATFWGGSGVYGDVYGDVTVNMNGGDINGVLAGGSMIAGTNYGDITVNMNGGVLCDLAGASAGYFPRYYTTILKGNATVNVHGGVVTETLSGGSCYLGGFVEGNTAVNIYDGAVIGPSSGRYSGHCYGIYGGSNVLAANNGSTVSGTTVVNFIDDPASDAGIQIYCEVDEGLYSNVKKSECTLTGNVVVTVGSLDNVDFDVVNDGATISGNIGENITAHNGQYHLEESGFVKYAAMIGTTGYDTIAAAFAAVKSGDTILILAGTYTDTIEFENSENLTGVTITGEQDADGNNLVTWQGSLSGQRNGKTCTNCTLSNIDFVNTTGSGACVTLKECYNWTISGCSFVCTVHKGGYGWNPIAFPAGANGNRGHLIENCTFVGGTVAVRCTTNDVGYSLKVKDCSIRNTNFNFQNGSDWKYVFENNTVVIDYDETGREGKDSCWIVAKSADGLGTGSNDIVVSGGSITTLGGIAEDDQGWSIIDRGRIAEPNVTFSGVTFNLNTANSFASNVGTTAYDLPLSLTGCTYMAADGETAITDTMTIARMFLQKNGESTITLLDGETVLATIERESTAGDNTLTVKGASADTVATQLIGKTTTAAQTIAADSIIYMDASVIKNDVTVQSGGTFGFGFGSEMSAKLIVEDGGNASVDNNGTSTGTIKVAAGGNLVIACGSTCGGSVKVADGGHVTLAAGSSLTGKLVADKASDITFGGSASAICSAGSVILINEIMTDAEVAAWKTTNGIADTVTVRAMKAAEPTPVKTSESITLNLTESNPTTAQDYTSGDSGDTVGAIVINSKGNDTEVRGEITQTSATHTIVVNNGNTDDTAAAKTMAITGELIAADSTIVINNGKAGDTAAQERILNGGSDSIGFKAEAKDIVINNYGHAVVDLTATNGITIHNNSVNTLKGVVNGAQVTIDGTGVVNDAVISASSLTFEDTQVVNNSTLTVTGELQVAENAAATFAQGTAVTAGTIALAAGSSLTIDASSSVTASSLTLGDGSLTIDCTSFSGRRKVLDLSGSASLEGEITVNGATYVAYGSDGDVTVWSADQDILEVNGGWSGSKGDAIAGKDGYYYGINAFSSLSDVPLTDWDAATSLLVSGSTGGSRVASGELSLTTGSYMLTTGGVASEFNINGMTVGGGASAATLDVTEVNGNVYKLSAVANGTIAIADSTLDFVKEDTTNGRSTLSAANGGTLTLDTVTGGQGLLDLTADGAGTTVEIEDSTLYIHDNSAVTNGASLDMDSSTIYATDFVLSGTGSTMALANTNWLKSTETDGDSSFRIGAGATLTLEDTTFAVTTLSNAGVIQLSGDMRFSGTISGDGTIVVADGTSVAARGGSSVSGGKFLVTDGEEMTITGSNVTLAQVRDSLSNYNESEHDGYSLVISNGDGQVKTLDVNGGSTVTFQQAVNTKVSGGKYNIYGGTVTLEKQSEVNQETINVTGVLNIGETSGTATVNTLAADTLNIYCAADGMQAGTVNLFAGNSMVCATIRVGVDSPLASIYYVTGSEQTAILNLESTVNATNLTVGTNGAIVGEGATITVTTGTFSNAGSIELDEDSSITTVGMTNSGSISQKLRTSGAMVSYSGAWSNTGDISVDMSDATAKSYLLVDYTGSGTKTLSDYGDVTLNNSKYTLAVVDSDLYAVDISVIKVNTTWTSQSDVDDGYTWGVNAFGSLTDAAAMAGGSRTFEFTDNYDAQLTLAVSVTSGSVDVDISQGTTALESFSTSGTKSVELEIEKTKTYSIVFTGDTAQYTLTPTLVNVIPNTGTTEVTLDTTTPFAETGHVGYNTGEAKYGITVAEGDSADISITLTVTDSYDPGTGSVTYGDKDRISYWLQDENGKKYVFGSTTNAVTRELSLKAGTYTLYVDSYDHGEGKYNSSFAVSVVTSSLNTDVSTEDDVIGGGSKTLSTSSNVTGFVGLGDKQDWIRITQDSTSAKYDITFKATEGTAARGTRVYLYEGTDLGDGDYTKKLVAGASYAGGTYTFEKVVLDASKTYFFNVTSPSATSSGWNATYTMTMTYQEDAVDISHDDDTWAQVATTEAGVSSWTGYSHWVGAQDTVDWVKLATTDGKKNTLALDVRSSTYMTAAIYQVAKNGTNPEYVSLKMVEYITCEGGYTQTASFACDSTHDYYACFKSSSGSKASAWYNFTMGIES